MYFIVCYAGRKIGPFLSADEAARCGSTIETMSPWTIERLVNPDELPLTSNRRPPTKEDPFG
jgi:hypothetical protein